jgi:hypothetical protein
MKNVHIAKAWDCVQAITKLCIDNPFCYEQLKVSTLHCLFSSLSLLYLTASPWVEVVTGGCYKLLVQGPCFFSEADEKKSLSSLLDSMWIFRWCEAFFLTAPFICKHKNVAFVITLQYCVNANLMCQCVFYQPWEICSL